ncbi:uncharacterized protein FSUBG_9874 [Fusarium subglutinans]|uniref:Uncharacterized protein n=1 Tax=Gibberella subglutinans TaxID=42677 RepID=A0A8H5PAU9_GIBSU|nr:uncharacterized protein FSUBG_9874 [Fusarium subglutinans]KAF5593365.1 hypothetical protein FSUBG_9874 [Fusarium subglutinans]
MRLTDTILVALQASMGLALVLPNDDMKKAMAQHKHNDADPEENKFHGYERITKITSHRYFGPKDHKHHHEEKKHDDDSDSDSDSDDDDDDDEKKEHVFHSQKVKEKHNKSKEHDDDDDAHKKHHSHDSKKKHHSHDSKKKQHDKEDDDKDEESKLTFPTDEYKKAKKHAKDKFPFLKDHASETPKSNDLVKSIIDTIRKDNSAKDVELETPKHYNKYENQLKEAEKKLPFFENVVLETAKRYNKHKNEDEKEQTNSKDGKLYKIIHRGGMDVKHYNKHKDGQKQFKGDEKKQRNSKDDKTYKIVHRGKMDVKRDIDINIHAPTYAIYHDSDEKHDHGDTKLVKIFHVSSQESTHETKYPKYKHDDEQKHRGSTKEHQSLPKSKNYDSHDKGHVGSKEKYSQSSKGHNQTQGQPPTPVVQVTKKILDLIGPFVKEETGRPDSSKEPSHQYKSYPSQAYSYKGRPSPHGNRYPSYKKPYSPKDTQHDEKLKNGQKKSDQAKDGQIGEQKKKKKNNALRAIIEALADLLAKKPAAKHDPKKTHPSKDNHDSHHESDKKHYSHERPPYRYKEHAEYKHDDNKKHVKLSQDSSSHYEPGYKHEKLDSHHGEKKNAYYYEHEDSKKGQYSNNKPVSQYKKKIDYKHDDEKKHIKASKEHISQYEPTHHDEKSDHHHPGKDNAEHPKRPEPHHDYQEAEHHEDSKKSKDYHSSNKPKYGYKEHSKYKHDDDNERGPFDQRVKLDHKPIDHYTKFRHHEDHEDETKAYKDRQSHHGTHTKRSSNLVPKLNTTQILNLEALSPQDRKRIAMGLPLDPQTRKEFGEFKECTPKLITKLNIMYARIVDDPKYAPFIKYLNTKREFRNRKRSNSVLTPEVIAKIEAMPPLMRSLAADQLDFSPELKKEFVNAGKFSPGLIKKLEKEYERIEKDPKYKKILEKLKSHAKRATSKSALTPEILAKIESMPPLIRMIAADKLDFSPELKKEFVQAKKFSPELIKKLEKEYERIEKDPKYKKILEKLKSRGKRAAPNPPIPKIPNETLKKIEALDPVLRRLFAVRFGLPAKLTDEFVDCGKLDQDMIHKLNWEYARIHKDPKYKNILEEFNAKSKRSEGQGENTEDGLPPLTEDDKKEIARSEKEELEELEARKPKRLTEWQLKVIARMPKAIRSSLAEGLHMPQDLHKWFSKNKKLSGKNVERLNEEYIRVQLDHQDSSVVRQIQALEFKADGKIDKKAKKAAEKKLKEAAEDEARARAETPRDYKIRKRSVHQLTEKELERMLKLDKYERQALVRKLGLEQSLAHEFINASKPSTDLLEKLNEAVSKSVGTPQYQELLKLVGKESPKPKEEQPKLESIKKEVRLEIAKTLEFDEFTRNEFLEAKKLEGRLLDKVVKAWGLKRLKNAKQGKNDIKHSEVISKLLEPALEKADLQSKGTDGKKLTEAEQKMKKKLEKTKSDGWCDEFVAELQDAWGPEKKDGN